MLKYSKLVEINMENEDSKLIEEIGNEMLKFKITGKGEIPSPANEPELFAKGIEYLLEKGYITKKIEDSETSYPVTINGKEYALKKGLI